MIGPTGAGKSTTLHYLGGSKFVKEDLYLRPVEVKISELHKVVTGKDIARSQTRYITPVPITVDVDGGSKKIWFCDAPGSEDVGGPEIDISNIVNIVSAVKSCRSVRIVILLSKLDQKNRGEGLVSAATQLSEMIRGETFIVVG